MSTAIPKSEERLKTPQSPISALTPSAPWALFLSPLLLTLSPPFIFLLTVKTPEPDCHWRDYLSDQCWNWFPTLLFISLGQKCNYEEIRPLSGCLSVPDRRHLLSLHTEGTQVLGPQTPEHTVRVPCSKPAFQYLFIGEKSPEFPV